MYLRYTRSASEIVVQRDARHGMHVRVVERLHAFISGFILMICFFNLVVQWCSVFRFDIQHFSVTFNGIVAFFRFRIYPPGEFIVFKPRHSFFPKSHIAFHMGFSTFSTFYSENVENVEEHILENVRTLVKNVQKC